MNVKTSWLACGLALGVSAAQGAEANVDLGPASPEAALALSAEALLVEDAAKKPEPSKPTLEQVKEERLSRIIIRPSTVAARPAATTPAPESQRESKPASDPTLIAVPSNTLGPGEPLWVRSDRQSAQARVDAANARIADQEAARNIYEDNYDGLVVYGPHAPGWGVRGWYGNIPHARHRGGFGPGRPIANSQLTPDPYEQAQIQFGNTAYPKIGPIIEGQLEAQRQFGKVAAPPIIGIQNNIDQAQLRARRGAPLPK